MKKTLKPWPFSSTNNSRQIVRKELVKMRDNPSSAQAQKLEDRFGIVVDFQDSDYGEPPFNRND